MKTIVDLFCGGGGSSTGIVSAFRSFYGDEPLRHIAIDWDAEALAMHEQNHPDATHILSDIWNVDPVEVMRPSDSSNSNIDLLWLSPSCTQHSRARGAKPKESKTRDLAWVGIHWIDRLMPYPPRVIILENVPEFVKWGPLDSDGYIIKSEQGSYFNDFRSALQDRGYRVVVVILSACDYGVPTTRKRLYLIAHRDGRNPVVPKPTHGAGLLPYHTATECLDWSIPCPSIFDRTKPLAPKTQKRIADGLFRFVLDNPNPYIAPIVPVTFFSSSVDCVASFIAQHYRGRIGLEVTRPVPTVTAVDHHSLCAVYLHRHFGNSQCRPVSEPVGTITADGLGKTALIAAFIEKYYGTGGGQDLRLPFTTVTTKDRFGLVTINIDNTSWIITDIGIRMLQPRELFLAQGFPKDYIIDFTYRGKPFSKTAQVRMAGNAVCPPVAEAIVKANLH